MANPKPKYAASSRLFVDEHVDITDTALDACVFDGCIVVLSPIGTIAIRNTVFVDCDLVGDGWCPELLAKINAVKGQR